MLRARESVFLVALDGIAMSGIKHSIRNCFPPGGCHLFQDYGRAHQDLTLIRPDLLVIASDCGFGLLPALSAQVRSASPDTRILLLTGRLQYDLDYLIAGGLDGYLCRDADTIQVANAIRVLGEGGRYFDVASFTGGSCDHLKGRQLREHY